MKKTLIAAFVGGLIIFIWEFVSYGAANFHNSAMGYTEKQDAIREFVSAQQLPEGGYVIPSLPKGATKEEWDEMMAREEGKPWISIQYHSAMETNMIANSVRGLIVNVLILLLFMSIISKFRATSFRNILLSSLFVGLIVFLNGAYTGNIWYDMFDIWVHLLDAIVCWGLVGAWLGWYLNRGNKLPENHMEREKMAMAE